MSTKIIITMLAVVALGGCASAPSGSHEEVTRLEAPISKYQTLSVSVTSNLSEAKESTAKIEKAVTDELAKSFPKMQVTLGNKGAAQLRLKIVDYKTVGKGSRFLAGTMAGSDKIVAEVEVYDSAQKRSVGSFKVKGENVVGSRFWENGIDAAISEVAKETSKYLRAKN